MNAVFPIAFLDPPQVLNTVVTNIPGAMSAPLQVVDDIGFKAAFGIQYTDTTGDYVGVYIGAAGFEVLKTIIGGGQTTLVPVVIPAHSRVSFRSMTSSAITNGDISCVFLGMGPGQEAN